MERDAIKQTPQRRGDKGSVQRSLRSAGRCGPTRLPWRPLQGSTRQTPAHKMVHCVQHCTTGNRCNGVHDAYALYSCYSASNGARLCDRVLARVELLLCETLLLLLRHLEPPHKALRSGYRLSAQCESLGLLHCVSAVARLPGQHTPTRATGFALLSNSAAPFAAWLGSAWLGGFTLRCEQRKLTLRATAGHICWPLAWRWHVCSGVLEESYLPAEVAALVAREALGVTTDRVQAGHDLARDRAGRWALVRTSE